jgi:predicted pyridoxine 5'-phosphate oxidase superfamily flavin-nucleotide-binding protein
MSALYGESHRALQREFDTERLADRLEQRLSRTALTDDDKTFVERLDMLFFASVDERGQPTCSYKGGDPGFVRVLDPRTLAFPCYDGNGMFLSMGNVSAHPAVGLLFIDFQSPKRLRVHGRARREPLTTIAAPWPEAQFAVLVEVERVFPNCPRYIHQRGLESRSPFVPHAGVATPVPAWKRMEWAVDVLPAGDPANPAAAAPSTD